MTDTFDPMAVAAGEVDTSFPRLAEGIYTMVIRNPSLRPPNEKGTEVMEMKLETTKPARDTEGNELHVGYKITHYVAGTTEKRDKVALAKDLAFILKSAGLPKTTPGELWANPSLIADKLVQVKVAIQKERDGYPESNRVKQFIIPS